MALAGSVWSTKDQEVEICAVQERKAPPVKGMGAEIILFDVTTPALHLLSKALEAGKISFE